jgi:hypothetical protein
MTFALAALLAPAMLPIGTAQAGTPGRDQLTMDFTAWLAPVIANNKNIPANDKPRTTKCLAQALVADIPEPDAQKLSDIFEKRAAPDNALKVKWLTIGKKAAPARYQQVINAMQKTCPDLVPYVEPMF